MGLNDSYAVVRSNILMMSPLPNLNHAYSMRSSTRFMSVHSSMVILLLSLLLGLKVLREPQGIIVSHESSLLILSLSSIVLI